jgi:hypothetical protein
MTTIGQCAVSLLNSTRVVVDRERSILEGSRGRKNVGFRPLRIAGLGRAFLLPSKVKYIRIILVIRTTDRRRRRMDVLLIFASLVAALLVAGIVYRLASSNSAKSSKTNDTTSIVKEERVDEVRHVDFCCLGVKSPLALFSTRPSPI